MRGTQRPTRAPRLQFQPCCGSLRAGPLFLCLSFLCVSFLCSSFLCFSFLCFSFLCFSFLPPNLCLAFVLMRTPHLCCYLPCLLQSTTDEHFRFHAFSTLYVCLERIRHHQQQAAWEGSAGGAEEVEEQAVGEDGAGGAKQQARYNGVTAVAPLLDGQRQQQLLQLLWQGFEVRWEGPRTCACPPPTLRCCWSATKCTQLACECYLGCTL